MTVKEGFIVFLTLVDIFFVFANMVQKVRLVNLFSLSILVHFTELSKFFICLFNSFQGKVQVPVRGRDGLVGRGRWLGWGLGCILGTGCGAVGGCACVA